MMKTIFSAMVKGKFRILTAVVALTVVSSGAVLAATYTGSKVAFVLNKTNLVSTVATKLYSNAAGAALTLGTHSTSSSATPLSLKTKTGEQAPMQVNSETKVTNLNADKLDDQDSTDFAPSLWAKVKADGTLLADKGATSVTTGGGGYFVRFDRDITNCAYIATVGEANTAYFDPGEAQATHTTGNNSPDRDVYVAISDNDTGAIARGFSLVVVC